MTFSRAVRVGSSRKDWNTKPIWRALQQGPLFFVQGGQELAADFDVALAGDVQAGQQPEQGGLAGAGRPHQGQALPGLDFQPYPLKDGQ
jgi:hypothetical protein